MANVGLQETLDWLIAERANYEILKDREYWILNTAAAAVEKQIPANPIRSMWSLAKCPSCGCDLGEWTEDGYHKDYEEKKVCCCGQKLNWEN